MDKQAWLTGIGVSGTFKVSVPIKREFGVRSLIRKKVLRSAAVEEIPGLLQLDDWLLVPPQ